jgi:hypothetical protein
MANLSDLGLDPNVKENTGEFILLPAGKYPMIIINDLLKDNSKKTGKVLEVTLQVSEGEFEGEELRDWWNLINPSADCQRIGQGTFKRVCNCVDVPFEKAAEDTRRIWGIPLTVKVKQVESEYNEEKRMQNKITSYSKAETQSPTDIYNHGAPPAGDTSGVDNEW